MNAPRWLGRLRLILDGFGSTRGQLVSARSKAASSVHSTARRSAHRTPPKETKPSTVTARKTLAASASAAPVVGTAAVSVMTMTVPVSAIVTPSAVATARRTGQPQRTLVEVRADLARLRESSRQRQAEAERARDTSFAPTDFMELLEHALPAAASTPALAPTAYLDFGAARARQGR
jgi:hypothetical protein